MDANQAILELSQGIITLTIQRTVVYTISGWRAASLRCDWHLKSEMYAGLEPDSRRATEKPETMRLKGICFLERIACRRTTVKPVFLEGGEWRCGVAALLFLREGQRKWQERKRTQSRPLWNARNGLRQNWTRRIFCLYAQINTGASVQ